MPTMVPDRGDSPKRRIKYSDMNVERIPHSGAYNIYHSDNEGYLHQKQYYGYSKRDAMKLHKQNYESGK